MYNYTLSKKTIANISTEILAKNADRKVVILCNDSNEAVYIGLGEAAVMNSGIALTPNTIDGQRIILSGELRFTGIIYAICASGSKNLAITEGE